MAVTIFEAIRRSDNWILDAVRFAAVWVAYSDHEVDNAERAALEAMVPDRPGGVALRAIIDAIQQASTSQDYGITSQVFAAIKHGLADDSKTAFLRLVIDIAGADGRVSQGERHALIFLAELIGRPREARKLFLKAIGLPLYKLADLSDPAYWEKLAASQHQQRTQEQADAQGSERRQDRNQRHTWGQGRHPSTADPRRTEALAVLGLVGEPSLDDIKAAYRTLARIHHPDRYASIGGEAQEHATRNFQRIQVAYAFLKGEA